MTLGTSSFIRDPFENLYGTTVLVGNYTSIAAGLKIVDIKHPRLISNYAFNDDLGCRDYPENTFLGTLFIGNDVLVGAYCVLTAGIVIGDGVIIKAGSTVTVDVPPYAVMSGNTITGYRFPKKIREELLELKWWDWPEEKIKANMAWFKGKEREII
jgi:virginiamycin A acetyltransferase